MCTIWIGIALCQNIIINKKTSVWQALSEHFSDFLGADRAFKWKNGALRWSIFVGKQKHNVQKPTWGRGCPEKPCDISFIPPVLKHVQW